MAQPGERSAGEGSGHTARMHVSEESHSGTVPMSHSNKDEKSSAESEEGRPLIKENAGQPNTYPTQSGKGVSQGLTSVRKAARAESQCGSVDGVSLRSSLDYVVAWRPFKGRDERPKRAPLTALHATQRSIVDVGGKKYGGPPRRP